MVFGIGEGKIGLELNTHDVASGGKISGTLRLELNSPKKAKELRVELIGEQKRERNGKMSTVKVYEFKQVLGGEQEYTNGEYQFELTAPAKTEFEKKAGEGALGAIVGAAKMLGAIQPVKWYVVGTLDLPMSLDINKKVQVAVL
jgi:hypothetical protein